MAIVETKIKLDDCLKDVDLSNKILNLNACANYLVYEEEFKDCTRYYGCEPFRFNTKNLKGCYKHYMTWNIKHDIADIRDSFHVSKLYNYNDICHLTKNELYSFFCIADNKIEEIRIPSPMDDLTEYTQELYDHIKNHPELLQDIKEEVKEIIKPEITKTKEKFVVVKPKKIKEDDDIDDFI